MLIYYLIGILVALIPLFLVFTIGPQYTRIRVLYMILGFTIASTVGGIIVLINIRQVFSDPLSIWAEITDSVLGAFLEELFRYPGIILTQMLGVRLLGKNRSDLSSKEERVSMQWTSIEDPHGMAIYFGTGWGTLETIIYYIHPKIQSYMAGDEWHLIDQIQPIAYRITAVMAHISLSYLALIITVNRSFYRFTILLHTSVNLINEVFNYISPNFAATVLWVIFSRFALVVIVYYMLRPRVRYLSPAILLLIEVVLFLVFITLGSIIYLFSLLLNTQILDI